MERVYFKANKYKMKTTLKYKVFYSQKFKGFYIYFDSWNFVS